ncbi:MAG TPA: HIT family protein [Rudaea sp.]|jgi:diadenosine tetraphosphate (Ap4A) HIT family hydrolase|nr:HIT family protein [Rudaea sp.]
MNSFALDPQLDADTHRIGDMDFTRVLLMDDARFPWLILVPRVPNVRELTDLALDDQHRLLHEIDRTARVLHAIAKPDKLNIAMLGNVVAQLHVHVIARYTGDEAWPKPVWGIGARRAYDADVARERIDAVRAALQPVA